MKEIRISKKTGIPTRRILVEGVSHTIRPSFVMPYHVAFSADAENALFLKKFDVPFWALAHVFGKDAMYWYRMEIIDAENGPSSVFRFFGSKIHFPSLKV